MRVVQINGIWVIDFGNIQISGGTKEDLERLMNSFSDETDILEEEKNEYITYRCKNEDNGNGRI